MNLLLVATKNKILVVYNKLYKMAYFMITIEGILAERLARLFKDNMWKLHRLLESVILDWGPQFVTELTKELYSILDIETVINNITPTNRLINQIYELRIKIIFEVLFRSQTE